MAVAAESELKLQCTVPSSANELSHELVAVPGSCSHEPKVADLQGTVGVDDAQLQVPV